MYPRGRHSRCNRPLQDERDLPRTSLRFEPLCVRVCARALCVMYAGMRTQHTHLHAQATHTNTHTHTHTHTRTHARTHAQAGRRREWHGGSRGVCQGLATATCGPHRDAGILARALSHACVNFHTHAHARTRTHTHALYIRMARQRRSVRFSRPPQGATMRSASTNSSDVLPPQRCTYAYIPACIRAHTHAHACACARVRGRE